MFGISGVGGDTGDAVRGFPQAFAWEHDDRHHTFVDDRVGIDIETGSVRTAEQPVPVDDGETLLWLLGDVYGYFDEDSYVPCTPLEGNASACAALYAEYGLDFVSRLNGDFVGIVYDRSAGTLAIILDRLGSQSVFYSRVDGQFIFSTQLQSLLSHPSVPVEFHHDYLFEYLVFRRVFGIYTPFVGVKKLPPASVTTIDLATDSLTQTVYWEPIYRPIDAPFDYFVDRFTTTFSTILEEWADPAIDYGLLLSGGSDSRLILATMPEPLVAFHMCDWSSREMRTAERAARTAGDQFVLLERDQCYYDELYELNGSLSNFDGYFFQGYTIPFVERIRNSVDVLLSGLYADVLFKGHSLPTKSVSLGRLGTLSLPVMKEIDSISTLIEHMIDSGGNSLPDPPEYLSVDEDMDAILRRNITRDGEAIEHHGIRYNSLDDLLRCHEFYPLSNDTETIFTNALRQTIHYRTPFLDARLIDLHLKIPPRYRARKNLIYRALTELDPALANIPHVATGFPLSASPIAHYLGRNIYGVLDKHDPGTRPPKPYFAQNSWRNHAEFIRRNDFVIDAIMANRQLMDRLPFIDKHGAFATYTDHLDGADYTTELFTLVTLLGMPAVRDYGQAPTTAVTVGESIRGDA